MNAPTQVADATALPLFDELPLAAFLKETIRSIGYERPTPIQAKAIPTILDGEDFIGLAQTGTGKTAAFVLPLIQKLSGRKDRAIRALVLAPTRELAEQINDVIKALAPRSGIKSTTIYGGVSHRNQITALRSVPQIIVACPGRLMDHMRGGSIDLSTVEYLVLDEADRMLDMGFMPDIKEIVQELPEERQTMLFSATMPTEIRELSNSILKNPKTIQVKSELPVATVSHSMYTIKQESKGQMLTSWLTSNPDAVAVVFTKMKHTAKKLSERLSKDGVPATSLQGNLSQAKRQRALNGFKNGEYRVLIATDIASRGIDVDGITHVINYDMPDTVDAYIHRTGRAGRAARTGDAISFVTRADRGILRSVETWLKAPVARLEADLPEGSDSIETEERGGRRRATPRNERRRPREGRREREASRNEGRSPRHADREQSATSEHAAGEQSSERQTRQDRGERSNRFERRERPQREGRRFGNGNGRRDDRRGRPGNSERSERQPRSFDQHGAGSFDSYRQNRGERRAPRMAFGAEQSNGERWARREQEGRENRNTRGFQPRGDRRDRNENRPEGFGNRAGGFRARGERNGESSRGGDRPQREFRGQQDIDTRANYVYRPKGSHFIDRSDSEARPQGGNRFGRGPNRGGSRGPRKAGFQRGPRR